MKLSPLLRFLRSSIYRRTAVFSGPFQHFEVVIPSSMCVRLCPWGIDLLLSFSTFCVSVPSNHRTRLIIDGPLPVLSYFGKCVFIPGHSCILAQFNTSRWPLSAAQTHVFSCEGHWYPQAHFNILMLPFCAIVEQVSPSQGPQSSLLSYQDFEMAIQGGVGTCQCIQFKAQTLSLSHFNTSRWLFNAALEHVNSSQGYWWALAHFNILRWPFLAASVQQRNPMEFQAFSATT